MDEKTVEELRKRRAKLLADNRRLDTKIKLLEGQREENARRIDAIDNDIKEAGY